MKHPFSGLRFVVVTLCLLLAPARAATPSPASAGSISGRIHNGVTGQYLNNARVVVRGSDQVAFTDSSGSYRLAGVPPGPIVLEVFFTGLDPQQVSVVVPPGGTVEQDVQSRCCRGYTGENSAFRSHSLICDA